MKLLPSTHLSIIRPVCSEMSIETMLGIIGAVLFIAGLTAYLKVRNVRIRLVSFSIVVVGIILIAVAIVGLPA